MYQIKTRTSYSLLKSLIRIPQYIKKAKELNETTLGIMDENVLYGAVEFYSLAKKEGIKPIIGMSLEYTSSEKQFWVDLIAQSYEGYQNLMKLSSLKMIEKDIQLEQITPLLKDILVIFDERSEFAWLAEHDFLKLDAFLNNFAQKYLGIDEKTSDYLLEIADQKELAVVALRDVRYFEREDELSYQVLRAIGEQKILDVPSLEKTGDNHYLPINEFQKRLALKGLDDALNLTKTLFDQIDLEIPLHQTLLPQYPLTDNQTAGEYLRQLAFENLPKRVENPDERYIERLEMELSVIHEMGFDDYFLIVWDMLDFAHKNNIHTGEGRGSAAGALTAYVLNITGVDPIKYDLLFERFLNKERYSMPDIDIDIPDNKRQELLQYIVNKYGQEHVAQIATFGTLAAKQVLTDVSRVFGLKLEDARKFSEAVPFRIKMSLDVAFKESKLLQDLVSRTDLNQLLFETARKLEGLPRNVSTHAAGVVISDENLFDLIPLQDGSNDIYLTQLDMHRVEEIGLLKMDFLGLRNLTIIANTLDNIERFTEEKLDIHNINYADEATLAIFQKGQTSGLFQFESNGIRQALRTVYPTSIEDIAAVNALYRPGPQANIPSFAARKKGSEKITYPDESIRPILENTYGIIIYQEQIMQIMQKMAGFSLGEADIVRRAISKKIRSLIEEEGRKFVSGAIKLGYEEQVAKEVYDLVERFADYGFNRSHAFAYSFIAYQMAYLKVYYPAPFYQSLLRANKSSTKKVREYIAEARKVGVETKNPDINTSFYTFQLTNLEQIRLGLADIKGVRNDFIEVIFNERKANGRFTSFENFLYRLSSINHKWLKEDMLEALIYSGSFDSLGEIRQRLIEELPRRIENLKLMGGLGDDLFGNYALKTSDLPEYDTGQLLEQEKKYLGIYLSTHPLEQFSSIKHQSIIELGENEQTQILVQIKSIKKIRTKKNEQMSFLKVEDETGELDVTVFPNVYRKVQNLLIDEMILVITGKVEKSKFNENLQLLAETIEDAKEALEVMSRETLFIKLETSEFIPKLKEMLALTPGKHSVILVIGENRETIALNPKFNVAKKNELISVLGKNFGSENVKFYKK
ncbi:MAG: DNA polymerase III subunit alpha [Streptococcaceae bacterium]|jgi:DNA polymerase-3 subunit alpha|nr:DNA polymerase III subunit alpha [Streptococcaceae bacterium]